MNREAAAWADDEDDPLAELGDGMSALEVYNHVAPKPIDDHRALSSGQSDDRTCGEHLTLLFTVANPLDTVSVTASLSGQIYDVTLAPDVTRMTDASLAEEITVLAVLAQKRAGAAQHALIAHFMTGRGHDPAMIRSYLEREAGLPSPEATQSEITEVFASRYSGDLW